MWTDPDNLGGSILDTKLFRLFVGPDYRINPKTYWLLISFKSGYKEELCRSRGYFNINEAQIAAEDLLRLELEAELARLG